MSPALVIPFPSGRRSGNQGTPLIRPYATAATEKHQLSADRLVIGVPDLRGGKDDFRRFGYRPFPYPWVSVPDRSKPDLDTWARAIVETALVQDTPLILIAHGFGCLAAIRASSLQSQLIAGALLVAPPDPAAVGIAPERLDSTPDFPTVLVASEIDPSLAPARARALATRWGSELLGLGPTDPAGRRGPSSGLHAELDLLLRLCRRAMTISHSGAGVAS